MLLAKQITSSGSFIFIIYEHVDVEKHIPKTFIWLKYELPDKT